MAVLQPPGREDRLAAIEGRQPVAHDLQAESPPPPGRIRLEDRARPAGGPLWQRGDLRGPAVGGPPSGDHLHPRETVKRKTRNVKRSAPSSGSRFTFYV